MKNVFKKYFRSVISPDEFEKFCTYISQEENTEDVLEMMDTEWNKQVNDQLLPANSLLFQKIKSAILQDEAASANRKLKIYTVVMRVAAVFIIGLLFSGLWLYLQNNSVNNNISPQTVSIPYGATTQFQLPDGSAVWLNSGSVLTYSGNFSKQRKVELKGEAFFDVTKSKTPFRVNTSDGTIEVLGTAFNVQAYSNDELTVTLVRGIVNVTSHGQKQKIMLKPGEQVRLEQNRLVKNKVNTELFTSWKEGKLIFSREPFPDMIKRLERWFNVEIEHAGYDFDEVWFSGTIEGETLTEVMDMICKAAPVRYSYNSKDRKIKIEPKNETN